jgi:predicted ABC-type ATPase
VPDLIIIAGPNGAGKTTFAREYLSKDEMRFVFVNADEIARTLALEGGVQNRSDMRAGRLMLGRIDALVNAGTHLAIETTLATLTYAHKIPAWRQQAYNVSLVYLRLNFSRGIFGSSSKARRSWRPQHSARSHRKAIS